MLVGLSGWLVGYDGSFDFQSGATFPEGLNYWGMRLFNSAWGALMVPLAYGTAKEFGMSMRASILAATMVLFGKLLYGDGTITPRLIVVVGFIRYGISLYQPLYSFGFNALILYMYITLLPFQTSKHASSVSTIHILHQQW